MTSVKAPAELTAQWSLRRLLAQKATRPVSSPFGRPPALRRPGRALRQPISAPPRRLGAAGHGTRKPGASLPAPRRDHATRKPGTSAPAPRLGDVTRKPAQDRAFRGLQPPQGPGPFHAARYSASENRPRPEGRPPPRRLAVWGPGYPGAARGPPPGALPHRPWRPAWAPPPAGRAPAYAAGFRQKTLGGS